MKTGYPTMIPNIFSFFTGRPRLYALALSFCVLMNSFCPRSLIELKNYDVVVLAMGSQSVFLHLFTLPNKVSVELANLLFNDKNKPFNGKTGHGNKTKAAGNSSSDFSILCLDQKEMLKEFQMNVSGAGAFIPQIGIRLLTGSVKLSAVMRPQVVLYCVFLLIFFSRPRGGVADIAINMILNNAKPGLNLKPGFLLCEVPS